jgi:hypothetical protein
VLVIYISNVSQTSGLDNLAFRLTQNARKWIQNAKFFDDPGSAYKSRIVDPVALWASKLWDKIHIRSVVKYLDFWLPVVQAFSDYQSLACMVAVQFTVVSWSSCDEQTVWAFGHWSIWVAACKVLADMTAQGMYWFIWWYRIQIITGKLIFAFFFLVLFLFQLVLLVILTCWHTGFPPFSVWHLLKFIANGM